MGQTELAVPETKVPDASPDGGASGADSMFGSQMIDLDDLVMVDMSASMMMATPASGNAPPS
jgi:hypothetical protein